MFVRVRGEIEMRETSEERRRVDAVVGGQEHPVLEDALGLRFIKALVILLKHTINAGQRQDAKSQPLASAEKETRGGREMPQTLSPCIPSVGASCPP